MWALCCDTKGCATVGLWKQLTFNILTVRALPANTAHSPNVGSMYSIGLCRPTLDRPTHARFKAV